MTIILPVPPSANRYWRVFRGRPVVSSEATAYKNDAAWIARAAGMNEPLTGDVSLTVRWYRERKSGDLSNRLKILEDALQGIAYKNDSQIVRIVAERYDDKRNPRVEVEVTPA